MKLSPLILLFLVFISVRGRAQSNPAPDKEKLFELYQNQRYAEAARYLKEIYGNDINDVKALTQIGYCFLMAGNTVDAEKHYARAYELDTKNLSVLFSLASINNRRGNDVKAKTYYTEIVKIDSNNFNVYKQLANLYPQPTDSLKIVYLKKANSLYPTEADVAYDLADAYQKTKKPELAYKTLDIAILADTDNLVLQKAKLPIANSLKKYAEVIKTGEKMLKAKNGADGNVLKDVAMAYYYTKQYQKAIELLQMLEKVSMQNEATLYFTTLSYRQLKDYKNARIYARKTIEEGISANTSNYYDLLGLIYEESDGLSLALSAYKKGLEYKSTPSLYYHLGTLYDTKYKNSKTALSYYKLYLKSKPDPVKDEEEIKFTKARIDQIMAKP